MMKPGRTILVVEDDPSIAKGLRALLASEGYRVAVAGDGVRAVRTAGRLHPALVLLDVNLPGMSGMEVCRTLRSRGFVNPVIMLTARTEQADKLVGLEVGADDYITKPFDSREVVARVRSHIRMLERLPAKAASHHAYRRRLLAVMFTDMKDYTRLMRRDETLALKTLETHNRLIRKLIKGHSGVVIEVVGDAFLASFENALSAVRAGIAILRGLVKLNQSRKPADRITVRIGIHVGDVIQTQGGLKGDTVNIAARLQQLAVPGTMAISHNVFGSLKGKGGMKIRRRGTRRVKNIREPITVYAINP
jgi:DNA-binding response OmpR family regulator